MQPLLLSPLRAVGFSLAMFFTGFWLFSHGGAAGVSAAPASSPAQTTDAGIPFTIIDSDPSRGNGFIVTSNQNHIVRDSDGVLYVAYTPRTQQSTPYYNYIRWSEDGGATWSNAVRTENWPDSNSVLSLAIDGNDVLLQGYTFNTGAFFTKSTDKGKTWSPAHFFHDAGYGIYDYRPSVVVDDSGRVHAVYYAYENWTSPPSHLWYVKSYNAGDTWTDKLNLTEHATVASEPGPHKPVLYAGKDGWLYLLYNHYKQWSDVQCRFMYFDGISWSQPITLSSAGASAIDGDLVVDSSGRVHFAWSEKDAGSEMHHMSYSSFDPATRSFSKTYTRTHQGKNVAHISMGIYKNDEIVIAYDVSTKDELSNVIYQGVYTRSSTDAFAVPRRISTHPNAREPNLRSYWAYMAQPDRQDIIWIEPNDVTGGESLVYGELTTGVTEPEALSVNIWGPRVVNPGQDATYLIEYRNTLKEDATGVVVQSPFIPGMDYVTASPGVVLNPDTHEVFWRLGTVPSGEKGYLTLTTRVPWATPEAAVSLVARIGASSLTDNLLDLEGYEEFTPIDITRALMSGEEVDDLLSDPAAGMMSLTKALESMGYESNGVGEREVLSTGQVITRVAFLNSDTLEFAVLVNDGQRSFVRTVSPGSIEIFDENGGWRMGTNDGSEAIWGGWSQPSGSVAPSELQPADVTSAGKDFAKCLKRCGKKEAIDYIAGKVSSLYNIYSTIDSCLKCRKSSETQAADCVQCADSMLDTARKAIPGVSEGTKIGKCIGGCAADPTFLGCKEHDTYRSCSWNFGKIILHAALTPGKQSSGHAFNYWECNAETGDWNGTFFADGMELCSRGTECQENEKGKAECVASCPVKGTVAQASSSWLEVNESRAVMSRADQTDNLCDDTETEIVPAHDPNAKSVSAAGEVIPGQTLTYTIEYENEGAGTAFEVFIHDVLDANLDESTLHIGGGGDYTAAGRLLSWSIGTLQPGEQGSVTFSVKVREGLPSGTEIVNLATVHFPSAGEVTPTNPVVSRVKPLVADPQILSAVSSVPKAMTLTGRDAGGQPVTFRIAQKPLYGTLTGTPPSLTYKSMDAFSGQDEFYFVANNGVTDSEPARIAIVVEPNPNDTVPPDVIHTLPKAGDLAVHLANTVPTGAENAYWPAIVAAFSEPIDPSTVTSDSFTLSSSGKLSGHVSYDSRTRTATFLPSSPLQPGVSYTVKLGTAIADMAGNSLAQAYVWKFTTQGRRHLLASLPYGMESLDFGQVAKGQRTPSYLVALRNTGNLDTEITQIALEGDDVGIFKLVGDGCSGQLLKPGDTCTCVITCIEEFTGKRSAEMRVVSNASNTVKIRLAAEEQSDTPASEVGVYLPFLQR